MVNKAFALARASYALSRMGIRKSCCSKPWQVTTVIPYYQRFMDHFPASNTWPAQIRYGITTMGGPRLLFARTQSTQGSEYNYS